MDENKNNGVVVDEVKATTGETQTTTENTNPPAPAEPQKQEPVKQVTEPEKSWLHKKAEKVCASCAAREKKKADKKAAKAAKQAEKAASGGLTTKQKIGIGIGIAAAAVGGGILARGMATNGNNGTYVAGPGEVREVPEGQQQMLGDGSVIQKEEVIEPVNVETTQVSDYPTE